jgi:uncharacterized protein (UPF0276 family)
MNNLTSVIPVPELPQKTRNRCAGFGLGLRTPHYSDFLAKMQPLDWLEIITDNFLVEGGKPLLMLDTIRRDYPIAMHGVAMSIGAAGGIDEAYVRKVKALATRIEPMWISDHLCWTGPGPEQLHDLYPMPYTDEAARHVIEQIRRTQDILQRQLVLENVSSYIDFKHNSASEWQFLAHIADTADCLLLVDINNIYVSSVNHHFDPLDYLNALPKHRVQQIHLAGHSDHGDYIVDTHDHPMVPAVWDLYAQACRRFGPVATMIERDDKIPPLQTLIEELNIARGIAAHILGSPASAGEAVRVAQPITLGETAARTPALLPELLLARVQRRIGDYILDLPAPADSAPAIELVLEVPGADRAQRLGIYHNAYRARLAEVLAESFSKTNLYMGSDAFNNDAIAFAVCQPPMARSLSLYGANFPAYLAALYPDNPELRELAQLDWDLRTCFDGPDVAALTAETAQAGAGEQAAPWLKWQAPLHPSVVLRAIGSNVTQIWRAIDADEEVPEVHLHTKSKSVAVWRKGLQPHFQTLDSDQATFLRCLQSGQSIEEAADALAWSDGLPDPQRLGGWLQAWLADGLLRLQRGTL